MLTPTLPPVNNLWTPVSWPAQVAIHNYRQSIQELARRELAKRSLLPFTEFFTPGYLPGWVHQEVADLLDAFIEACEQKKSPRLMIFLPPRSGKSQLVSRCFPPYLLGKHPDWEIIAATYNQDLANDFGRDVRAVLSDPMYQEMFPDLELRKDSNAVDFMQTTQKGKYMAVGVGGSLTGRGAHALIIDDPVKNREDADSEVVREQTWKWYLSSAYTRVAPGGGIIVLQTRWHEDDLAGRILEHAKNNPGADQWHVYSFPAIAIEDEKHRKEGEALHPERYPVEALNRIRNSLDAREWWALYQQNPVPLDGNFFKRDWFKTYTELPKHVVGYVASDLAIGEKQTNDFTVVADFYVDSDDNIYFPDPAHFRGDAFEIVETMLNRCDKANCRYLAMETGHISKTLGPLLKKRMQERGRWFPIWDATPSKDKQARARSLQGRMQQGKVFFQRSRFYEETLQPQFLGFPASKHDDIVDSYAWACLMLEHLSRGRIPTKPDTGEVPLWSLEGMQRRTPEGLKNDRRHVPTHLNGKPRAKPK